MSLSRGEASRTKWQQSNKATVTSKGIPSTASAVRSSRGRERGREGGRADIKPELLSPQKLFKEINQSMRTVLYARIDRLYNLLPRVCKIMLTCCRSLCVLISTDYRELPRHSFSALQLKSAEIRRAHRLDKMSRASKLHTLARLNDITLGSFSNVPSSETLNHLVRYLSTWSGSEYVLTLLWVRLSNSHLFLTSYSKFFTVQTQPWHDRNIGWPRI